MKAYPHHYTAGARGAPAGLVPLSVEGLPPIESAPPPEFDGPGGVWSPETLLVASIADCFILTFRSIARATRFEWDDLHCTVEGVLDRVAGVPYFTRFTTRATLTIRAGANQEKAREHLERAEKLCLISNSLRSERLLEIEVVVVAP